MTKLFSRLWQFFRFYRSAVTKYQLHSPFVFELAETVLDNKRWYYAFRDVEMLRQKMRSTDVVLQVRDFGTGTDRKESLRKLVRRTASSACQGQQLFRLANWVNPRSMLELGTSVGIGSLYLISGARTANLLTLEGCPETAQVARANFDLMGFSEQVSVEVGAFEQTLPSALKKMPNIDLVYLDGNHRQAPTLEYFEQCLPYSNENTVFVFDYVYWSKEMGTCWLAIQQHPRVTLTVDFYGLSLAFVNPDFKVKQHYKIVPFSWKIWKFY